jgi:hypothetical protein
VKINIYDILGRDMALTCPSMTLQAGEHNIPVNGSALASGVYFVKVEAGTQIITQKILLLR